MGLYDILEDHASELLFGAGVGGLAVTIACSVKDTKSYIQEEEVPETFWGKVRFVAKHYYKTAIAAAVTLGGFALSKAIDDVEIATLGAALGAMAASRKDILKKTDELYGEGASEEVQKEIAKDKIAQADTKDIQISEKDEIWCYYPEEFGGGTFKSTRLDIMGAELILNHGLNDYEGYYYGDTFVSTLLGHMDIHNMLPNKNYGAEYCWDVCQMVDEYSTSWVEIYLDPIEQDDGTEVYYIRTSFEPTCVFDEND